MPASRAQERAVLDLCRLVLGNGTPGRLTLWPHTPYHQAREIFQLLIQYSAVPIDHRPSIDEIYQYQVMRWLRVGDHTPSERVQVLGGNERAPNPPHRETAALHQAYYARSLHPHAYP